MPAPPSPRAATHQPLLEICVESLAEAKAAVEAGASRLEICGSMSEDGITPSIGLIGAVVERVGVPAFVMIRPRGGDFVFDAGEVDVMLRDIEAARRVGAHGIVSGALTRFGIVDRGTTQRLVDASAPLPFTFHRAIDLTPDVEEAFDVLRAIGVRHILTSGGASSALVGADVIARLVHRAGDAISIIAGGSVRAAHVIELVQRTAVSEVHARPTRGRALRQPLPRDVRFGSNALPQERPELDPDEVRALAEALHEVGT